MTEKTDLQRVKDLYAIICNRELPDSKIQERTNIVRELERITGRDFRNTAEFHHLVADYIKRQEGKRISTGKMIRNKRKAMGWKQADLAAHLGVTPRQVIYYENDYTPPTKRLLEWLNSETSHMGKSEIGGTYTQTPENDTNSYGEK
jgi:DNA-binding XRE family transcriptional regulator